MRRRRGIISEEKKRALSEEGIISKGPLLVRRALSVRRAVV